MNLQKGSLDHVLARADYFNGLVQKTTDPVHWSREDLLRKVALVAAAETRYKPKYANAIAMIEAAQHKASHGIRA